MTSRPLTIAAIGRLKCNVPIRIKIREDLVETTALINSGNKVQYPLIISGKFANELNLEIKPPTPRVKNRHSCYQWFLEVDGDRCPYLG